MNDEKAAVDRFQKLLGDWCTKTFPDAKLDGILKHLEKEVVEELQVHPDDPHELADCIILLIHYATRKGWSIHDAVLSKFEILKTRVWGKPDEHGVIEHVE